MPPPPMAPPLAYIATREADDFTKGRLARKNKMLPSVCSATVRVFVLRRKCGEAGNLFLAQQRGVVLVTVLEDVVVD